MRDFTDLPKMLSLNPRVDQDFFFCFMEVIAFEVFVPQVMCVGWFLPRHACIACRRAGNGSDSHQSSSSYHIIYPAAWKRPKKNKGSQPNEQRLGFSEGQGR